MEGKFGRGIANTERGGGAALGKKIATVSYPSRIQKSIMGALYKREPKGEVKQMREGGLHPI